MNEDVNSHLQSSKRWAPKGLAGCSRGPHRARCTTNLTLRVHVFMWKYVQCFYAGVFWLVQSRHDRSISRLHVASVNRRKTDKLPFDWLKLGRIVVKLRSSIGRLKRHSRAHWALKGVDVKGRQYIFTILPLIDHILYIQSSDPNVAPLRRCAFARRDWRTKTELTIPLRPPDPPPAEWALARR